MLGAYDDEICATGFIRHLKVPDPSNRYSGAQNDSYVVCANMYSERVQTVVFDNKEEKSCALGFLETLHTFHVIVNINFCFLPKSSFFHCQPVSDRRTCNTFFRVSYLRTFF